MATAAKSRLTVHDYVGHSFEPDCDFVNGVFEERNLGEIEHSEMQAAIFAWFLQHAKQWSIKMLPEMRIQVSTSTFRVADLAVVSIRAPRESILKTPPLLVVEILSPEDRISRYKARLDDYRDMGIHSIWVIDPGYGEGSIRDAFDCSSENWIRTSRLEVPGTPIFLALDELTID